MLISAHLSFLIHCTPVRPPSLCYRWRKVNRQPLLLNYNKFDMHRAELSTNRLREKGNVNMDSLHESDPWLEEKFLRGGVRREGNTSLIRAWWLLMKGRGERILVCVWCTLIVIGCGRLTWFLKHDDRLEFSHHHAWCYNIYLINRNCYIINRYTNCISSASDQYPPFELGSICHAHVQSNWKMIDSIFFSSSTLPNASVPGKKLAMTSIEKNLQVDSYDHHLTSPYAHASGVRCLVKKHVVNYSGNVFLGRFNRWMYLDKRLDKLKVHRLESAFVIWRNSLAVNDVTSRSDLPKSEALNLQCHFRFAIILLLINLC